MECFICLDLNKNLADYIQVNSPKWNDQHVQNIIEKHLWPMVMFKKESKWLCSACWQVLQDFHQFYMRVESVHINYECVMKMESEPLLSIVKDPKECLPDNLIEPEIILDPNIIKKERNEYSSSDGETFNDEDDIPLINMCGSLEFSAPDSITSNDCSMDPLNKEADHFLQKRSKRICKNSRQQNVCSSVAHKTSTDDDTSSCIQTESRIPKIEHSLVKRSDEDSILRYYYESKLSVDQYDRFVTEHFELKCNLCELTFTTFLEIQNHYQKDHNKKRGYAVCCDTKMHDLALLVDHINCHLNPDYFKCQHCSKVLNQRKDYKSHIKTHEIPHRCDTCGRQFISKYLLNKHKLTHLSQEEKTHQCTECYKFFATEYLLSCHRRVVHLKSYSKLCDICGQSMPNIEALKRHMKKHDGITEPALSCDICGRLVSSKHTLRVHMKTLHPQEGQKDYVCNICFRVSLNEKALKEHIRRNHKTGYIHKCTICDKAFKRLDHLKDHVTTHTGNDMSKCPWCPRTFNANSSMHNHRKKAHPKEWEEARLQKYSGKMPPNHKPLTTTEANNIPLVFDL